MTPNNFTAIANLRRSPLCISYFNFSPWTDDSKDNSVKHVYCMVIRLKSFLSEYKSKYDFDERKGVLLVFDNQLAVVLRLEFGDDIRFERTI